jgi:phytanoyl-CoA hydroxylase
MTSLSTIELHPWNDGFTFRPSPHLGGLLDADQVASFDRDGFVVLEDLFTLEEIAVVRDEIDGIEAELESFLRTVDGEQVGIAEAGAITFQPHLVARNDTVRRFATDERFARLALDLVGPDVNLYWDQSVYKKTEKPRRFPWHQDNGYVYVDPQQYLTCWVALNDATTENGCPHVIPGLHRRGTFLHRYVDPLGWEIFADPPAPAVAVPVRAGGVVAFSSLTPHLTPANVSRTTRKAYILQYTPADAVVIEGEPDAPPGVRRPCNDPVRQPSIARAGRPVGHANG